MGMEKNREQFEAIARRALDTVWPKGIPPLDWHQAWKFALSAAIIDAKLLQESSETTAKEIRERQANPRKARIKSAYNFFIGDFRKLLRDRENIARPKTLADRQEIKNWFAQFILPTENRIETWIPAPPPQPPPRTDHPANTRQELTPEQAEAFAPTLARIEKNRERIERESGTGAGGKANMKPTSSATSERDPRPAPPPVAECALSEGIDRFLLWLENQTAPPARTFAHYRQTAWSLIEFLACDPPLRELGPDAAQKWLDWLRTTMTYRRGRGSYPRQFTRQSVSAFLTWPPAKTTKEKLRAAGTIAGHRTRGTKAAPLAGRRGRNPAAEAQDLPPAAADRAQDRRHRRRWQATLAAERVSFAHRRQIILTQGLILLWGVRVSEALTASLDDTQGHWVLCEGKTGMRIAYLNSQALGLVQALRGQATWTWAAAKHHRVSGWPWSVGKWHSFVAAAGVEDGDRPQHDLRKRFSTWVAAKDPQVEMLLAGHGGGVVFDHYLDTLERVPGVMEQFELPELREWAWPPPVFPHREPAAATWGPMDEAKAAAAIVPPRRLYDRFDRWLEEQERRAAE